MFCYILGEAAIDEFIQDLHLYFHSFLGFQHRSGLSVKAIMPLSTALSLAIGFKFFWFLIGLLLYSESTILALSFLNPKDICLLNQFSRGSWQKGSVSTLLTWCQRRNWVVWMIELMFAFNPSYVCHEMNIFWLECFVKFPWHCWKKFSQSGKHLGKTSQSHGNLRSLTDLSGANSDIHSNSRD